jgi:hypothetical protein
MNLQLTRQMFLENFGFRVQIGFLIKFVQQQDVKNIQTFSFTIIACSNIIGRLGCRVGIDL